MIYIRKAQLSPNSLTPDNRNVEINFHTIFLHFHNLSLCLVYSVEDKRTKSHYIKYFRPKSAKTIDML